MEFSKSAVAALALPAGKSEHFEWDPDMPGFGVRLRGKSKAWTVQYRIGKQQRRESLGDVRKVTLEDARKIARQRFAKVELGVDPGAERDARARAQLTLGKVVARYLDAKEGMLRANTFKAAQVYFSVKWKPLLGQPIDSIKRADVAARLQEIIKAHGRVSAARARAYLSALFSWAMREGLCETNPVIATNDPAEGIEPRERVLDDAEIKAIWRGCFDDDFGRIVRLLLLTGCRREEIGALKWNEINFEAGTITVAGERTKNHRTLTLPVPPMVLDILRAVPRRDDREYVFGGQKGGEMGFAAWSWCTLALHARIATAQGKMLNRWTLHDLRRTMRTGLGKLGVAPHIAELAINHVKGGVQAIYDKYTYQPQIKAALALWAQHVIAIVEGREPHNVAPLSRA
jgi:integrase